MSVSPAEYDPNDSESLLARLTRAVLVSCGIGATCAGCVFFVANHELNSSPIYQRNWTWLGIALTLMFGFVPGSIAAFAGYTTGQTACDHLGLARLRPLSKKIFAAIAIGLLAAFLFNLVMGVVLFAFLGEGIFWETAHRQKAG